MLKMLHQSDMIMMHVKWSNSEHEKIKSYSTQHVTSREIETVHIKQETTKVEHKYKKN